MVLIIIKEVMTENQDNAQQNAQQESNGADGSANEDAKGQDQNDQQIADDKKDPETFDYGALLDDDLQDDQADDGQSGDDNSDDDADKSKKQKQSTVPNKALQKVSDHIFRQSVKSEVDSFFANNPEAAPLREKVERWVNHPNRMKFIKQGLPVSSVIHEALAPYQQQIGARKAKAADEEASATRNNTTNISPKAPDKTDWSKVPAAEVLKTARLVMNRQYGK